MEWVTLATTAIGLIASVWAYVERRRAIRVAEVEKENVRLKVQNDRIKQAAQIDEDIDALSDDDLRERMRNSVHNRDGRV